MEETQTPVSSKQSLAIPAAIVIAGLAIAAAIYFGNDTSRGAAQRQDTPTEKLSLDPITAKDHIIGNPKASVIVIEYSDTECPYCKIFHETMNKVMADYGSEGNVAWIYRHLPFHSKSSEEAQATECVAKLGGNEKFWQYLNTIFEITPANDEFDLAELPKIAQSIGIDVDAFNTCLRTGETKSLVEDALKRGYTDLGIRGTPYSLIVKNGKVVGSINGAQPYEAVKAQLDALLK